MSSPVSSSESATEAALPGPSEPRRMAILISIFITILLVSTWFVSATWRHFFGVTGIAWLLMPLLFTLSFIPAMLLGLRHRHPLLGAVYKIAAVSLGFLNYALFAAVACWIIFAFAGLISWPVDSRLLAYFCFGAAALTGTYGLLNAACLRVTRVTVPLKNLPSSWKGRRIALVSDVHLGNMRGAGFVRRIVSRLTALKPDAVFIAGDMFDGAEVDLAVIAQPWSKLSAPSGIYFVSGNHDEFSDRRKYFTALSHAGIRVLNNEKIIVDGLQIVGVHDGEAGDPAAYREILRHAEIDRHCASILLTHQPSRLEIPEAMGISLQLSGHTHGGQFWPWSGIVSRVHGRFAYGLNRLGNMFVYTSSGAGTWGPPVRVGTRSELVLLEFA